LWDINTGRELRRFVGHKDIVISVAFSPDGEQVLTGSKDQTALLWDVNSGKILRQFEGHSNSIVSVAFSPDRHAALTASYDSTARLWDVETGKELRRFYALSSAGVGLLIASVAISSDGKSLVAACTDDKFEFATLLSWDIETGKQLKRIDLSDSDGISAVMFSSDGSKFLAASGDIARILKVATGREILSLDGASGPLSSAAFSPDGRTVLSCGSDGNARLWDAATGKELKRLEGHTYPVKSVAFSPNGRLALTGSEDKTARLWDLDTGKELKRLEEHALAVDSAIFSPDGQKVLTGSEDGITRVWDLASGRQTHSLGPPNLPWDGSQRNRVAVSVDGQRGLTLNENMSSIETATIWDLSVGSRLGSFVLPPYSKMRGLIKSIAFLPDGREVAIIAHNDGTIAVWDLSKGKDAQVYGGHQDAIISVAYSSNWRTLLTGGWDTTARLWDFTTGREMQRFLGHSDKVFSVDISPDERRVLTASADGTARLWDVATGKEIRRFGPIPGNTLAIAFSPDGREGTTVGTDSIARIWNLETGQEIRRLVGHSNLINSFAYSPDGKEVLTSSDDGTTRLWETSTGVELATILGFSDGGWAVVDPRGHYDASDPDNLSSLYWVTDNLRTIDLGQLKEEYYTPGLLARVLRGERLPDVTGMDTVALPPVLSATAEYNSAKHQLPITIRNDSGGVGKLLVKVNDRLLQTIEHPVSPEDGKSLPMSIDLGDAPFVPGENIIRVTAYDAANRIESQQLVVHYTMPAAAKGAAPSRASTTLNAGRFFGIVVGTSVFGDPKLNLQFPAKDADSIATGLLLGAERLYGKDQVWIRILTSAAKTDDSLPTKKNIRAAFEEVRRQAHPEDTLVVYLSGHGAMSTQNRDLYYYLTADARTLDVDADPALRDVSTVSSAELFDWLREPVKTMPLKQVVILDTCAAGGAANDLMKLADKREVPPDQRRAIELLKDATGTFILMGSAADSASFEASKYGEGLLTYALLQGMRGRSLDDGSRLGVSRWFEDASEQVPELSKTIGGIQRPIIAAPRGRGFPVALLTAEDRARIPLALPRPQLLRVTCEDSDGLDPLHLRSALREQLRALAYDQSRGGQDAAVLYLDSADDDLPGALRPSVRYQISDQSVSVRIRLIVDEKSVAEATEIFTMKDAHTLADAVATKIVALSSAPH
jgi:WD40 repeat protein